MIFQDDRKMLRLLVLVSVCILLVVTSEVCDDKYCLSTGEDANSFENAKTKCDNSWLLEIYDENVIALLKKLNVNNQQNNILLGMTKVDNRWLWSYGSVAGGHIYEQTNVSDEVACIITNNNNNIEFNAKKMNGYAGVICSKVTTKDSCAEWFYYGMCYFKLNSATYTWYEAHNECIKNQASMATFNYYNKSFIDNQLYWIGLSKNTWIWTLPGAAANNVVTFNKWASGNPYRYPNDNNNIPRCATTNSDGREWKSVDCSGTFYIVCMRDGNITSEKTNEDPLSIGAKAGIGVGVSLFIIIIIIIGVLIFKYFHHFKTKSRGEIKSEEVYEKPDFNNSPNHIYQGLETN